MVEEFLFSGYCRCVDSSRIVTVEVENGQSTADCSFGSCPYETSCTIAQSIRKLSE